MKKILQQITKCFSANTIVIIESVMVLLITFLTVIGLNTTNSFNCEDFGNQAGTISQIIGTIYAIFFSLILLPIQQISSRYSTEFLKYIIKDKKIIKLFILSTLLLAYCIIFLSFNTTKYLLYSYITSTILLIIEIAQLIVHIIKMLNPETSILKPIVKETNKHVCENLDRNEKNYLKHIIHIAKILARRKLKNENIEASKKIKKVLSFRKKEKTEKMTQENLPLYSIDEKITNYIKNKITLLREVAVISIKENNLGLATKSINSISEIVTQYFHRRKNYKASFDEIPNYIIEEFNALISFSNDTNNIKIHPEIIKAYEQMSIAVSSLISFRNKYSSFNPLTYEFQKALEDMCLQNAKSTYSYAPTSACIALSNISVALIENKYLESSLDILKFLSTLSTASIKNKLFHITRTSNAGIMENYWQLIKSQIEPEDFSVYITQLNEDIKTIIKEGIETDKPKPGELNKDYIYSSFFLNVRQHGLKELVHQSLFYTNNENIAQRNISNINDIIDILFESLNIASKQEEYITCTEIIDLIYIISIYVLSYIDTNMLNNCVFIYNERTKDNILTTENTIEKAKNVINNILEKLTNTNIKNLEDQKSIGNVIASLFFIILYEKQTNEILSEIIIGFEDKISALSKSLINTKIDSNSAIYTYLRLIRKTLENNQIEKQFTENENIKNIPSATTYENQHFWIIKRPSIFGIKVDYYGSIDSYFNLHIL